MGQSTSTSGNKKSKEIDSIIDKCYRTYFKDQKDWTSAKFYQAVCETVEEINKRLGSTQLSVPKTAKLELAYTKYKETVDKTSDREFSKDEFQEILQEVLIETGFTGIGAKDILIYIFGIPVTALMFKRHADLKIHDDIFIPAVTSATVFLLAKLNKI